MRPQEIKSNKSGFTLIELLVVISVIGVIASVALVNMGGMKQQAAIAKSRTFSASIQQRIGIDLAGAWDFDEGAGAVATDVSGNGNNGTISGATFIQETPKGNGITGQYALNFDGVDDYVEILHSSSLEPQDVSIEAMVKLDNDGTRHIIAAKWIGYTLEVGSTGFPLFQIHNGGQVGVTSGNAISWGGWHHLVGTFDAATKKIVLYVDGMNTKEAILSGNINYSQSAFRISNTLYGGGAVNGSIDNVRIYGAPLSLSAVRDSYFAGLGKLCDSGRITKAEYNERIRQINKEYAAEKY